MGMIPSFEYIEAAIGAAGGMTKDIFQMLGEPPEVMDHMREERMVPTVALVEAIEQILGKPLTGKAVASDCMPRIRKDIMEQGPFVKCWIFYRKELMHLNFIDYKIAEEGDVMTDDKVPEGCQVALADLGEMLRWVSKQEYDPSVG